MSNRKHIKLRLLMVENQLTQQNVADILKINVSTFNHKINGKKDFTLSEIYALMCLFNISFEELFNLQNAS